ncbi:MAG: DUF6895 family protein [Pseudonocardiaceae bacterium]
MAEPAQGGPAAAWITAHLTDFVPAGRGRARVKPLWELAMVHTYLAQWSSGQRALEGWGTFLRQQCAAEGVLHEARFDRRNGLYLMQPYAWLRAGGQRDAACEQVIRQLWRAGAQPTSVGQVHSLWKAGFIPRTPDFDGFCRKQVLGRRWSDPALTRATYRITHAVFYATDLGGRPASLDAAERRAVGAVLRRAARLAHDIGHWDRMIECSLALRALGERDLDWTAERGADGAVPRERSVRSVTFADCYHSTLADLMLTAHRTLCPPDAPERPLDVRERVHG